MATELQSGANRCNQAISAQVAPTLLVFSQTHRFAAPSWEIVGGFTVLIVDANIFREDNVVSCASA